MGAPPIKSQGTVPEADGDEVDPEGQCTMSIKAPKATEELLKLATEHAEQHSIVRMERLGREHTGVKTTRCPRKLVVNYVLHEENNFDQLWEDLPKRDFLEKKRLWARKLQEYYQGQGVACLCQRCVTQGISSPSE